MATTGTSNRSADTAFRRRWTSRRFRRRRERLRGLFQPLDKFFADRGTHLAAMIAYFALLSLVPLIFLALALFGLFDRADESTYLVRELEQIFPAVSIDQIVSALNRIQANAATLGVIGGVFLVWTSLSLFSVLESAFNIVYGRPNRSFLRGKALALLLMLSSMVILFLGLVVGSVGYDLLQDSAPGLLGNDYVAATLSVLVSTGAVFIFLVSVYYLLTNDRVRLHEVLPGAVLAAVLLQVSFQALPIYLRLTAQDQVISLQALGAPVILLIWLYVMANVIVFGAEVNWWRSRGRRAEPDDVPGLA
ncbi:MAG: YihY/virulence factor BrkB family protein [Actinobacteria bacterium]|nr:YihY/virulence factor BrkB family protein [Actinomycetota bacterium]